MPSKSYLLSYLLLFIFVFVLSCSSKVKMHQVYSQEELQRIELTQYYFTHDYKVSENEIYDELDNFLLSKSKRNSDASNTKSLKESFSYSIISSSSIPFSNNQGLRIKELNNESKTIENDDSILLQVVSVRDSNNDSSYAIVSDDKRIGTLLMYTDDSDFTEDISGDSFLQFISISIQQYIDKIKSIWDSIDETDLDRLKEYYGITDEQIEKARKENGNISCSTK